MMRRDTLFRQKRERTEDFHFGQDVAEVFDDMLDRSVPFSEEIQRLITELGVDFASEDSQL
ncbi:MAG: carboxy-S-adenosyl-L-methionine synthase CmoA, partial [Methylococcaceae bacterium]